MKTDSMDLCPALCLFLLEHVKPSQALSFASVSFKSFIGRLELLLKFADLLLQFLVGLLGCLKLVLGLAQRIIDASDIWSTSIDLGLKSGDSLLGRIAFTLRAVTLGPCGIALAPGFVPLALDPGVVGSRPMKLCLQAIVIVDILIKTVEPCFEA